MIKDVGWGTVTVFSRVLVQWLLLTVLNKFFSLELVGEYTLALAIIAPIFMFSGLQLRNIQIVDADKENTFFDYFNIRFISIIVSFFIILGISFFYIQNYIILLCVFLLKVVEQINDIIYGYYQKNKNFKLYGFSNLIKVCFEVLAILLVFINTEFLYLYFILCFIINVLFIFLYDFRKHLKFEKFSYSHSRVKNILRNGFPLGFSALISSLTTNVPRYLIVYYLTVDLLGIYGSLFYLCNGALLIYQPFFMSLRVKMTSLYANNKLKFVSIKKMTTKMLLLVLLGGSLLLYYLSDFVFLVFLTKDYFEYKMLFISIFIGLGLSNLINVYSISLQVKQIFNKQMYISMVMFLLTILLVWIGLAFFGINGLIVSSIICGLCNFIGYKILDSKYD